MMSNSHAAETFPPELCPPPPGTGREVATVQLLISENKVRLN